MVFLPTEVRRHNATGGNYLVTLQIASYPGPRNILSMEDIIYRVLYIPGGDRRISSIKRITG